MIKHKIMKTYNKSEIMKRAHQLKKAIGYDTFSQALKHSWLVAKNEAREVEQRAAQEAIYATWAAQAEAKRKAEVEAENARIAESGLDLHAYTMRNYYSTNRYNGD